MEGFRIPANGTRVRVTTQSYYDWMNKYRRPVVGIVASSNAWDPPGTFRLVHVEGYQGRYLESVTSVDNVVSLEILGPLNGDQESKTSEGVEVKTSTFEIKGSGDNIYVVKLDGDRFSCTCQAGAHGRLCKHVKAARELQESA